MTYTDISTITWAVIVKKKKVCRLLSLHISDSTQKISFLSLFCNPAAVNFLLRVFDAASFNQFLFISSPSVALQGRISSSNRGDEQAQTKPGKLSRRCDPGAATWSCHLKLSVLIAVRLLAGIHGLQERARQDADVTQKSAPAGVQLLE